MPLADPGTSVRQSRRFLYLYAMAAAGGAVAYVPFLTILLPLKAARLADQGALPLLAYAAFFGAIAASAANIAFGWLSDVIGTRRPLIAAGMALSSALLCAMPYAVSSALLIGLIVCWQLLLNMMLAPLAAWAGDAVPDGQKGRLGGLLAFAPALGGVSGVLITLPGVVGVDARYAAIAVLVVLMVSPVLVFGRPVAMLHLQARTRPDDQNREPAERVTTAVLQMWLARLLVQVAEASLFAFLLLWFRSLSPGFRDHDAASIFTATLTAAVVLTLAIGRWSDRTDQPILPLAISAASAALGLLMMAAASTMAAAIAGYFVFGLASGIFLALHSSQTLRVLPSARTRGRDLGLFNLTNTVPSLVMPWLTLALVPVYGFGTLFLLLSALALLSCLLLITMPRQPAR